MGLTDPSSQKDLNEDQILSQTKIGRFELNKEANNTQTLYSTLADYTNKNIQKFMFNQTLTEGILNKNSMPTNIKSENLLDLYLRKLMLEQGKRIPTSCFQTCHRN